MRFATLKRHWERFGRRDPYWAVLTDPEKRCGAWDTEGFFRSGADEIDAVLRCAEASGVTVSRRRALDFGCGAGRLTQAMATHFARSDGVDISESMLQVAKRHNRYPDRCSYHLNTALDLAFFEDASFDFVYSTLVLQHMRPRYSKGYVRELVRVLAPRGLLVVQVPSNASMQEPPPDASQTPSVGPLPPAAFDARLTTEPSSVSARSGEQLTLEVTAENRSPHGWSALPDPRGRYQINVANHWLREDGTMMQRDDARSPLSYDVTPGSRASVTLLVTAPRPDGVYWLEVDLVQEDVGWFGERGSPTLRVPCGVGTAAGLRPRPPIATAPLPPFRERHPGTFRMLDATGVRDAYWAWRRGVDRLKSVRDQTILALRERLYTPYAPDVINWWKRGPFSPQMEMYCVPRTEMLSLLGSAGGRVVDIEEHSMPPYRSYRYWVSKD